MTPLSALEFISWLYFAGVLAALVLPLWLGRRG